MLNPLALKFVFVNICNLGKLDTHTYIEIRGAQITCAFIAPNLLLCYCTFCWLVLMRLLHVLFFDDLAVGRIEILNWLLDQKECTGMERDYYQCTPMHDAAEAGNLK